MIKYTEFAEIVADLYKKKHYKTIFFPIIPLSNNDTYILTDAGDTLTEISYKFWGKESLWWIIPCVNPHISPDSFRLKADIQLRIPDLEEFTEKMLEINS